MEQTWISLAGIVLAAIVTASSQRINARLKYLEGRLDSIDGGDYPTRLSVIEDRLEMVPRRKEVRKWPH